MLPIQWSFMWRLLISKTFIESLLNQLSLVAGSLLQSLSVERLLIKNCFFENYWAKSYSVKCHLIRSCSLHQSLLVAMLPIQHSSVWRLLEIKTNIERWLNQLSLIARSLATSKFVSWNISNAKIVCLKVIKYKSYSVKCRLIRSHSLCQSLLFAMLPIQNSTMWRLLIVKTFIESLLNQLSLIARSLATSKFVSWNISNTKIVCLKVIKYKSYSGKCRLIGSCSFCQSLLFTMLPIQHSSMWRLLISGGAFFKAAYPNNSFHWGHNISANASVPSDIQNGGREGLLHFQNKEPFLHFFSS